MHHRWPVFVLVALGVWLAWASGAGAEAPELAEVEDAPPAMVIQVGPPEVMRGPDSATDNPFHTWPGASTLLGYVANGSTWGYAGGSLETLRQWSTPVLEPGTAFDSCGAWLNSVWQDGAVLRGWYHAETECPYPVTHKSVAYAESYDGGRTFVKPDYPHNHVITTPPAYSDPDQDDEGDQRVIRVGDYLYMYFLTSRDWKVHLARSRIADGGRPGTWWKYYNGAFSEPGIGGESSPIDASWANTLTRSWVTYNSYLGAHVGFSYVVRADQFAGFGLTVSSDGIHNWTPLPYLVLPSGGQYWPRTETSTELVEYLSLLSTYGDGERMGDTFWVYYMYLHPGEGFDHRYLVRRMIHLGPANSGAPVDVVPRIALAEYQKGDDTWFTTTNTDPEYERTGVIGYLFSDEIANSIPVYDCYIAGWDDHMLVPDDPACGGGEVRFLRRVGWISTVPFRDSVRVYRCWDEAATNHFMSTDPLCEGKANEWAMGYLATMPALPQNEFVALSDYYHTGRHDNWVTTSIPPADYAFQSRLGYLFSLSRQDTIPVYDCYIDFWADHMLAPNDPTCDGAQNLGLIGWISTRPFPGSAAVYRCFDEQETNHFVTADATCGGKRMEWRMGYVATRPAIEWTLYLPQVRR